GADLARTAAQTVAVFVRPHQLMAFVRRSADVADVVGLVGLAGHLRRRRVGVGGIEQELTGCRTVVDDALRDLVALRRWFARGRDVARHGEVPGDLPLQPAVLGRRVVRHAVDRERGSISLYDAVAGSVVSELMERVVANG